jgi:predicted chitinase
MIDRKLFFDGVRAKVFRGILVQQQVDSMNAILDQYDKLKLDDLRWLADILGTVFRECGSNMAPVRETFATSDAQARQRLANAAYAQTDPVTGQSYYGRGLVQLTHKTNYAAQGNRLGIDLLNNPDLALELDVATDITFHGMINGDFTGKKLADFFNLQTEDWIDARRIINGLDHAQEVADVSRTFFAVLKAAQTASA